MAFLEQIYINGQQAINDSITIAGLHPVFHWDFSEDVAAFAQAQFYFRIGDSAVDAGTDDFDGNRLAVFSESSSNFYEYSSHNLLRGETYYGQVKVVDPDLDETPWITFAFTINNLPFVTNFFLTPSSPTASDDIELHYSYHDVDDHDEAGTKIRWYRNNIPVPAYDDLCTLPAKATAKTESWSAKIIPSDGLEFGSVVETTSVVIESFSSSFDTAFIMPLEPTINDILKAEWTLTEDEYTTPTGTVSYEWFINDIAVEDSNRQYMRLSLQPDDTVTVTLTLTNSEGTIIAETTTDSLLISDVEWTLLNVTINDLRGSVNISDLTPMISWDIYKTLAGVNDFPLYFRFLVTKSPSLSGPVYDTGIISYVKNSFIIPEGIFSRGRDYFIHIGISDNNPIPNENYVTQKIAITGSSWENSVDNEIGWTIETKLKLTAGSLRNSSGVAPPVVPGQDILYPRANIYIHDGSYFCSITLEQKRVIFHSQETVIKEFDANQPDLTGFKTFRISGKDNNVKIFVDNVLLLDASGLLVEPSRLKFIEYGDLDGKYTSEITIKFFRYTTLESFDLDSSTISQNTFYFHSIGKLEGGSIQYVQGDLISWLPDNPDESAKLIKFNETSEEIQLPTVTKNYSPITSIFIDKNRNKYIGTANGVNALYGDKHDPDYEFLTTGDDVVITTEDFDRITTVPVYDVAIVEPNNKNNWFTIDTSFRTIGEPAQSDQFETGDPYDPYIYGIQSHAIHYYSQRTHGHAWYDKTGNEKGWQVSFCFQLEHLEQDDYADESIDHKGFGVYINDGAYQEILYFYPDKIRLYYANVFVPIVTTTSREYRITGKGKNLLIYQKLDNPAITSFQLLLDGTGLFVTPSSPSGNSRNPCIAFDASGSYHVAWNDDGNGQSQILYSKFSSGTWSNPEIIGKSQFSLRNPTITIDSLERIWVAYEDTSWGQSEISVSVKDSTGWNSSTRITNFKSNKFNPNIIADAFDNIHLVWEDDRNGFQQIYWAQREKNIQAWASSGQFGEDTPILQQNDSNDPYLSGAVSFSHPKFAYEHPRLWLATQVESEENHISSIYLSIRDVKQKTWQSMGSPRFDSEGVFITNGVSTLITPSDRHCVNPSIAMNTNKSIMVVVWEDHSEPIIQIWGASFNSLGTQIVEPSQITSRLADCKNPSVGFVNNQAAIIFESDGLIYLSNYNSLTHLFSGSNTGDTDILLETSPNRSASHPVIPQFVNDSSAKIAYDFLREKNTSLESTEFPDYYLIGEATISHSETYPDDIVVTSTTSDAVVSNIDSKEFAFGDMSENISLTAHWKDIKMYFGYDAKPLSIGEFNSSTVFGWGDNRINDLFVDVFGNLIVAKYDGLVYYNVYTGTLNKIALVANTEHLTTSVKWGRNGTWYVGTTVGLFVSKNAGKSWAKFPAANFVVYDIAIDANGNAICATNTGVVVANSDLQSSITLSLTSGLPNNPAVTNEVRCIAVDENNIYWAGGDFGLIRIQNRINFLLFNKKSGMSSSHVNDITIVNKYLRYIATANGINKMSGTIFSSINARTHDLINNNISQILWNEDTQSLWVSSLHTLHEIIFRDPAHEIIDDEVVQYDHTELLTEESFDTTSYNVLNLEDLDQEEDISPESVQVLLNKHLLTFGFSVGDKGKSVTFLTPLLAQDEVEILISNKFVNYYDFNQTNIEKRIVGDKRKSIPKIIQTITTNQTVLLTGTDVHEVLLLDSNNSLPFTTVLLDRELPTGCFQQIDTLTPTTLKFKILALDRLSGIDGYKLSNYDNFTSDGETELDFETLPLDGIVTHNIGAGLNAISTSFEFPDETDDEVAVGDGAKLSKWVDVETNVTYLYAGTSNPPMIWRLDPALETWEFVILLDVNTTRSITDMKFFNNALYVSTADSTDVGIVYKSVDGISFNVVASSLGSTGFNAIAVALDGIVYFGDESGRIFRHKNNSSEQVYSGIGNSVLSMDIWKNLLVAGTGNGRVYLIDLETDSDLIVFSGDETSIDSLHIKDSNISSSRANTLLYIGSNDSSTIYRANLENLNFIKSYSTFNVDIENIKTIKQKVLEQGVSNDLTKAVATIGDSLFKHNQSSWEFVYRHSEEINDFVSFGIGGTEAIFIISDSKIVKWTSQLEAKTVYLQLRDKAGNLSPAPSLATPCPTDAAPLSYCCNYAYSLKITDLVEFINESRIVDIDEYGAINFTFDSPNDQQFYSADQIDQEIGVYTSEIFNGSNDIVSWKSLSWTGVEPTGTSIIIEIRYGPTQIDIEEAEWLTDLVFDDSNKVSLESITSQYLQFRAILKSTVRDISPSLTSVVIRNLTTQASHFFTTNFVLPSRPIKGLLTANTYIPVTADVIFGINTKDSVNFADYQIIEPNRLFTTVQGQFGKNMRIGVKLLSPAIPQISATTTSDDPYDAGSYTCDVSFDYTNLDIVSKDLHFRVRFYNDLYRTQLIYTFFSGNDQTGWSYGSGDNTFPSGGVSVGASVTQSVSFSPIDQVASNQKWYLTIDSFDGSDFETVSNDKSYVCSSCNIVHEERLTADYYRAGLPTLTTVPLFKSYTPDYSVLEDNIDFSETSSEWETTLGQTLTDYTTNFAARFQGKIQAPITGTYEFQLISSDGSILMINSEEVIDHDGQHGLTTSDTGSVVLEQGLHNIEVLYFQSTGSAGLQLLWKMPGDVAFSIVPAARFFHAEASEYCSYDSVPKLLNFAILFELENGEHVKINLN
jgi:hypothetical protein